MKVKALGFVAAVALAGTAGLAGTLSAQEKSDTESRVRVMTLGQGSYLGVFISDVTAEDVTRLGLREERGVRITGVADEGPARDAGLEEDDVIVSWNDDRVESEAQLRRILAETPAGRSASLGVIRGGSERSIAVELGNRGGPGGVFALRSGWDEDHVVQLREQLEKSREHLGDLEVRIRGDAARHDFHVDARRASRGRDSDPGAAAGRVLRTRRANRSADHDGEGRITGGEGGPPGR